MDFPEIEFQTDGLLERLSTTSSAAERRDICWHLEGLKAAARIKEISDRSRPFPGSSVSRCGARGTDGHDSLTCTKGSPHGGSHYDENVQTYFNRLPEPAECGYQWTWNCTVDGSHLETCTLPPEHSIPHFSGATGVAFVDPIKPAADRLHELVSYFVGQSNESYNRSRELLEPDGAQAGQSTRFLAVSKAYDDAATKLQEILQEGGI